MFHKYKSKIFILLIVFGLIFTTLQTAFVSAAGNGSISISPSASQFRAEEPLTKGWIIEKMNPGDQVKRKVTISNTTNDEKSVILSEEDYYAGDQGAYSYTDKETLKNVGTWIKLDSSQLTLGSGKSSDVGVTITVPSGTKPGEYSGVIALQEAPKDSVKNSGLNFVSRVSTRVYITVPGDLKTGVKFDEFKFITTDPTYTNPDKYKDFLKANYNLPGDNIFMSLTFANTGNVFNKLRGNIEVTNPDGQVSQYGFNRDLGYGDGNNIVPYLYLSSIKWQKPGKYKAVFNFTNEPLISSNKDKVQNISQIQSVSTEFNVTQEMIDQIKSDLAKSKNIINNPSLNPDNTSKDNSVTVKDNSTPASSNNNQSSTTDSKKSDKPDYYNLFVFSGLAILVLVLIIIFLVIRYGKLAIFKKSKIENSESDTAESSSNPEVLEDKVNTEDFIDEHDKAVIVKPKKVTKKTVSTPKKDK